MDYSDHDEVYRCLEDDQQAELDLRESISEVISFMHHPQGQWEDRIWNQFNDRPRYTFDQTKPQVSKAWAEMAANEYAAETQPCGAGATEKVSNIIDGLIRNIYKVSSFDDISTRSGKRMIAAGFSAWRVISTYIGENFYQDLKIVPLQSAHERVWFDRHSELQTREDSNHVFILSAVSKKECEEQWPERDETFISLPLSLEEHTYSYKKGDFFLIGEILYKKPIKKMIYLLDDENQSVVDKKTLDKLGIDPDYNPIVLGSKECDTHEIYSRKLDGSDWLGEEKLTVFNNLPVIPEYANFDLVENKVTFEGLVQPIMDPCRVFNYTESRKVEEVVLSARKKIFMDERSAQGRADEISELHTNPNPVQLYRGIDKDGNPLPNPIAVGGIDLSPGLSELSGDMVRNIELTTGLPNELTVLQNTTKDSNFRFDQRTTMGQMGTFEFYRAHKVALEYTCKVMLGAIPKVYDTRRMVRTIGEDGQSNEELINNLDAAEELQNDLTVGAYDISIKVSQSFKDRQTESNTKILEMSDHVEGLAARNADILAYNIDAPGMRSVGDRERIRLMNEGWIPESQMTDEEKERVAQAQAEAANAPPDPATIIAQAEMRKAQAMESREQIKLQVEQAKYQLQTQKQMTDEAKTGLELQLKQAQMQMDMESQAVNNLGKFIDSLMAFKNAMGADVIMSPELAQGFENQLRLISEYQRQI